MQRRRGRQCTSPAPHAALRLLQVLYDKVCDQREKRLDEDDALAEVGKVMEGLRRDKEALAKKGRLVDTSLAAINADILEFQKEKQAHLNQIPTIVTLKLHQVTMNAVPESVLHTMPSELPFRRRAVKLTCIQRIRWQQQSVSSAASAWPASRLTDPIAT
jgi:hypothetical protein